MEIKKLGIFLLLIGTLANGMIFANGESETKNKGNKEIINLKVLDYFCTSDTNSVLSEKYNDEFRAKHPEVELEHEGLESSSARTKLAVEMASGNPSDISFMVISLGQEYSSKGLLLDVKPYIDADPEWSAMYSEATKKAFTWDEKIYLVPAFSQLGGMYCNDSVLKEAGFNGPAKTWNELLEQCKALKKIGKSGFMTNGKEFRYAWLISQIMVRVMGTEEVNSLYNGKDKTSWDDPNTGFIKTLEYFKKLVDAGGFSEDVNGVTDIDAKMRFADGQAAYWFEGSWLVDNFRQICGEEFRDSLSWHIFPGISGVGDPESGVGGSVQGFGISSKIANDPEKLKLALEYTKGFFDTKMASDYLSQLSQLTGTIPTEEALDSVNPLLKKQMITYGNLKNSAFTTDVGAPSPVDIAIKKIVIPGIIDGTMTPEEGAKYVNTKALEFWQDN